LLLLRRGLQDLALKLPLLLLLLAVVLLQQLLLRLLLLSLHCPRLITQRLDTTLLLLLL
jgi:hypothetical protein